MQLWATLRRHYAASRHGFESLGKLILGAEIPIVLLISVYPFIDPLRGLDPEEQQKMSFWDQATPLIVAVIYVALCVIGIAVSSGRFRTKRWRLLRWPSVAVLLLIHLAFSVALLFFTGGSLPFVILGLLPLSATMAMVIAMATPRPPAMQATE